MANEKQTVWIGINFEHRKMQEWYRKMNAKFNNKAYKEEPLASLSFVHKIH